MTNTTIDQKVLSEDIKKIKTDLALSALGATVTGMILGLAAHAQVNDNTILAISMLGVSCAPGVVSTYQPLQRVYNTLNKYISEE
ncbi:hypothetical protein HN681_03885 [archaeon]|jgi:hypothetical protein|nr:hypothetical protein [archaeon]MBT3464523.1 hypothetical protein [archaeon]MBT3730437.1 hypothetical protein [archaeon]MBT4670420.1 hypothetical protein [archaeon]MBT5030115.1 hypothetical protein [archaeon]